MELHEGQKIMTARWPEMTEALSAIFERCPAVAAHVTFDVERDCVSVKYNFRCKKSLQPKRRENSGKSKKNMTR